MRSLPNIIEYKKAKKREREIHIYIHKAYLSLRNSFPLLIFLDEFQILLSLLREIEGIYREVTIKMERSTVENGSRYDVKFSPYRIQNALTSCRASPQMITLRVMTMQFVSIKSKTTNIIASTLVSAIISPLSHARNTRIDNIAWP